MAASVSERRRGGFLYSGIFDKVGSSEVIKILDEAIQAFPSAPEGFYVVLTNPAVSKDEPHPKEGGASPMARLNVGRKINVPGPTNFALWAGQVAQVIEGHHLRSNQYLLVRVYNEEEARANWGRAIVKPQMPPAQPPKGEGAPAGSEKPADKRETPQEAAPRDTTSVRPEDLTMGQLLIVKGTDVSFYIPPTGIEVIPEEEGGAYVRDAVTLERLEYCILLDEDGNKRFVRGPDVVFPRPTERFVERNGSRKFRAIELNENSGIYIKVIADYKEGDGRKTGLLKAGEELFITGTDQAIYFPRPEHAIIKYGEEEIHFAVVVPEGEARYVLDKGTGKVNLVKGPRMFLPDPRKEVVIRRVLDPKAVELWFPGNREAVEHNVRLAALARSKSPGEYVSELDVTGEAPAARALVGRGRVPDPMLAAVAAEEIARRTSFTPPRTVTLNTKYDGAVSIDVWTGYAVLVVSRTGERRVVVGPQTVLLEYDETLTPMELSTGTPKTEEKLLRTVYLRVTSNKVSDLVTAETKDLCRVQISVSYRVNFEGKPEQWFNVENYVKFLTDHLRSLIRNAVKGHGIEEFYGSSIAIIRDAVLGVSKDGKERPGRAFAENGMRIYDVEVLDVAIENPQIADLLTNAQHRTVQRTLAIAQEEQGLAFTKRSEAIKQETARTQAVTLEEQLRLQGERIVRELAVRIAEIAAETKTERDRLAARMATQKSFDAISASELARKKAEEEQKLALAKIAQDQRIAELKAEAEAIAEKAKAISPDFISALQAFGDKELAGRMAESMAPLAILGGKSIAEILGGLLRGTSVEGAVKTLTSRFGTDQTAKAAK